MAYDEQLLERVRDLLRGDPAISEKRMFGGVCFLVAGNMAVAVSRDGLMVRVGKEGHAAALAEPGTRPVEMRGREMTGWVRMGADALDEDAALERWVERGAAVAGALPPKD